MSISNLNFTKKWTNPEDFPTIETSETQVREDLQLLHNETRAKVNEMIAVVNALEGQGVFIAQYSSTSYLDILAALTAGLAIFLRKDDNFYMMSYYDDVEPTEEEPYPNKTFRFIRVTNDSIYYIDCIGSIMGGVQPPVYSVTWWTTEGSTDFSPLDSPNFTGVPTAPYPDHEGQIATVEYADDVSEDAAERYLNRTNPVNSANTNYTTYMARGEALFDTETTPTVNGCIAWQYG